MTTLLKIHPDNKPTSPDATIFNGDKAFSRTIGFVTPLEMQTLRRSKAAIAGLGGVGGAHLEVLTRLGIGHFHVADFDRFEIHNFNRQAGASMSTLNQPKTEVMAAIAHDINPEATVKIFERGVTAENIEEFLDGVDIYIDGLDFFALDARAMVFEACHKKGIPVVTAAPLGMGAALMNFLPGGMSFEEYFRWKGKPDQERMLRFLMGLAPKSKQFRYLVWPDAINFAERRGPSTPMACSLCAGVAGTEALKILLKRGPVKGAPHSVVFDAYFNRTFHSWIPGGLANPWMRIKLAILQRVMLRRQAKQALRA